MQQGGRHVIREVVQHRVAKIRAGAPGLCFLPSKDALVGQTLGPHQRRSEPELAKLLNAALWPDVAPGRPQHHKNRTRRGRSEGGRLMWVCETALGKPVRNAWMSPRESASVMLSQLGTYLACSKIPSVASCAYVRLSTSFVFALQEGPLLTTVTTPELSLQTRMRAVGG
jgi:hypothetical protein